MRRPVLQDATGAKDCTTHALKGVPRSSCSSAAPTCPGPDGSSPFVEATMHILPTLRCRTTGLSPWRDLDLIEDGMQRMFRTLPMWEPTTGAWGEKKMSSFRVC